MATTAIAPTAPAAIPTTAAATDDRGRPGGGSPVCWPDEPADGARAAAGSFAGSCVVSCAAAGFPASTSVAVRSMVGGRRRGVLSGSLMQFLGRAVAEKADQARSVATA